MIAAGSYLSASLDFSWLFAPVEFLDGRLTGLLDGAPLLVALGIAFVLGLRHASDPDHLVAVTSLIAADREGGTKRAAWLGAWWGIGHATTLLLVGIPLIALHSSIPTWLESGAETGIGLVIFALAARVMWKWGRGEFRAGYHQHPEPVEAAEPAAEAGSSTVTPGAHHHLHEASPAAHGHAKVRGPKQAFGIGFLHGLAGTGAIVVLLLSALPSSLEAGLALAVFAPMSIFSMAAFTTAFAWILTRPIIEPLYRLLLIPALGGFGLIFGLWYAGIA